LYTQKNMIHIKLMVYNFHIFDYIDYTSLALYVAEFEINTLKVYTTQVVNLFKMLIVVHEFKQLFKLNISICLLL